MSVDDMIRVLSILYFYFLRTMMNEKKCHWLTVSVVVAPRLTNAPAVNGVHYVCTERG